MSQATAEKSKKLSLSEVKEKISELEKKETKTFQERKQLNALKKTKNQLVKVNNKLKIKETQDFEKNFEYEKGYDQLIRGYLNQTTEIMQLEHKLEKEKKKMENFKKYYPEVLARYEQGKEEELKKMNAFVKRVDSLSLKIKNNEVKDIEGAKEEFQALQSEEKARFNSVRNVGSEIIDKYRVRRKKNKFEKRNAGIEKLGNKGGTKRKGILIPKGDKVEEIEVEGMEE